MANEEHVKKLKEGVEAWNAWRKQRFEQGPVAVDLSGADLSGADLSGAKLDRADLSGANLSGADLSAADLTEAKLDWTEFREADLGAAILTGVALSHADLRGVNLRKTNLRGAVLYGSNLIMADLRYADLRQANLDKVNLGGAGLGWARLNRAKLREANLIRASLHGADLSRARLENADLTDADLTDVSGLEVDSCRVVRTRFSPNARDKWSILRRTYTGPRLVLNLLFLMLFFAPLIIKGAGLSVLGDAEQRFIEAVNHIDNYQLKVQCSQPEGAITGVVKGAEVRIPCRTRPVWKMLLGFGGPYENVMPYLTGVLIGYQLMRYWMTMRISAMREAEERSGISPPRHGLFSYRCLVWVHRLLNIVFIATLAIFGVRAYEFLTNTIISVGGGS
jgi:uncharacterized protein YjbI with pentapeptide repeats